MTVHWELNPFLTSWRSAVNAAFPHRTKGSDGTIGDLSHSRSTSEHNPDSDGSVDAWDCDINLFGSSHPTGTAEEVAAVRALLKEFQRQPQAQLWIFRGQICNRDIGPWKVRPYQGPSPHDHHVHFQSRSSMERQKYSGDLDKVLTAINRGGVTLSWEDDVISNPAWRADAKTNKTVQAKFALYDTWNQSHTAMVKAASADLKLNQVLALLTTLTGKDLVDEAEIAKQVLTGLDPKKIAEAVVAAMPTDQAQQVVNELSIRLRLAG